MEKISSESLNVVEMNINKLKEMYDVDVVIKQDIKHTTDKIDVIISKIHKDFIDDKETVKK